MGLSWRLDEPYVKIKGQLVYLYRAIDKEGHTVDCLLTPTRDRDAAAAFFRKAMRNQGMPQKITIGHSSSHTAAIARYTRTHTTAIVIRHSTYLTPIVEQDPRAVKRITQPRLGLTSLWAARCTIASMEVRHAIRQGPLTTTGDAPHTPAERCVAVAAVVT